MTETTPIANGVLIRVGSTENYRAKGLRYLVSGRVSIVRVDERGILAYVRGDGHRWTVLHEYGAWSCDCPARSACAHLHAVRQVVAVDL